MARSTLFTIVEDRSAKRTSKRVAIPTHVIAELKREIEDAGFADTTKYILHLISERHSPRDDDLICRQITQISEDLYDIKVTLADTAAGLKSSEFRRLVASWALLCSSLQTELSQ